MKHCILNFPLCSRCERRASNMQPGGPALPLAGFVHYTPRDQSSNTLVYSPLVCLWSEGILNPITLSLICSAQKAFPPQIPLSSVHNGFVNLLSHKIPDTVFHHNIYQKSRSVFNILQHMSHFQLWFSCLISTKTPRVVLNIFLYSYPLLLAHLVHN